MLGRSNAVSELPHQQAYPRPVVARLMEGLAQVEAEVNKAHDLLDELAAAARLVLDHGESHGFVYQSPTHFVDQLAAAVDRYDATREGE